MAGLQALVIGCGLSGSVVARELAERGYLVTIWERRDHIGGNMYDYVDEHGILVHKYGPHTFHTNDLALVEYLARFAEWQPYKLTCGAEINGHITPAPFNYQTIDDYYSAEDATRLKEEIAHAFPARETATVLEVLECNNPLVRAYGEFLFEQDYRPYTAKQWGLEPASIDPAIFRRVPLRFSYGTGYFDDKYQVMPRESYTRFFQNLLSHPNITVQLGVEALERLKPNGNMDGLEVDGKAVDYPVVYTGALDELFGCCDGALPYRSLRFEWKHEKIQSKQPMPVVAYPMEEYTRITEYNKLPVQQANGTSYAVEYSLEYARGVNEPYYPVLCDASKALYAGYKTRADRINNLHYCGRLADFRYYNMDQTLSNALNTKVCA